MTPGRDQTVELLHALGHLYARHSQPKRGLVLLLIAARLAPNDEGVLRTLAEAFLRSRSPQAAAEVLDRLQSLGAASFCAGAGRPPGGSGASSTRSARRTSPARSCRAPRIPGRCRNARLP